MPLTCPNCRRTLSESDDPDDPPQFCMYCGHRLRSTLAIDCSPVETVEYQNLPSPAWADDADGSAGEPRLPSRIGGLRLVRFLGAGGMGSVYEAVSDSSGQRVAVKLLSPKLASSRVSVERFRHEGRVASQINHPRCVFVLRADADAGWPFIVMELMPGRTLKDVVDEAGPLPPTAAIVHILDVIDGLSEAHRLGVIHRDVKPSNCFITADGRVKVGDFGLSKSLAVPGSDAAAQLTQSGAFLGTILFASPEQIRGEPVGYDSDVYAVCATLYFLLTGQAPHQHDSATAVVAKAISEPVEPVRKSRPKVPAELDRITLRGLAREREWRWQSLDDLRDALGWLLPANQRPARPRTLIVAYAIDLLVLQVPTVLLNVTVRLTVGGSAWYVGPVVSATDLFLAVTYFGVLDGLFGATAGKHLVGLRVSRVRETGPPGLAAGFVRSVVFHVILCATLTGVVWTIGPPGTGVPLRLSGFVLFVAGLCTMAVQFRASRDGYRGVHDRLIGSRTVQRPRYVRRTRLVSRFPSPLDRVQPSPEPLPAEIGGFDVRGKLCDLAGGGELWLAEDRALGRRVLIRFCDPGESAVEEPAVGRPARLRAIGTGTIERADGRREWVAFVAPTGSPLMDVTAPDRPLAWADARPVLEQLVDELRAAEGQRPDSPLPDLGRLWVEPGGRLQVLDFDLPFLSGVATPPKSDSPLGLVRSAATLTLEGRARASGGLVEAPIPPHASAVMDRLFMVGTDGYADLHGLQHDLAETHAHPARVTGSMRFAQLGVQAAMMAFGLTVMVLVTGLFTFGLAVFAAAQVWGPAEVRDAMADPVRRDAVLEAARGMPAGDPTRARILKAFGPENADATRGQLDAWIAHREANLAEHSAHLLSSERTILARIRQTIADERPDEQGASFLRNADLYTRLAANRVDDPPYRTERGAALVAVAVVVGFPLIWVAIAVVFRGGIAMSLAGITLVQRDGRPAARWRCAVRELVVWLPLTTALLVSLYVQTTFPTATGLRIGTWFLALGLLPLYLLAAMWDPERAPQDRVVGTHLVPA